MCNYRAVGEIVMFLKLVGTVVTVYRIPLCLEKTVSDVFSPSLELFMLVWDNEA